MTPTPPDPLTSALLTAWAKHKSTKPGEVGTPLTVFYSVEQAVKVLTPVLAALAASPAPGTGTPTLAEWGDAVAAIRGCPGPPPAEAIERLIAIGDMLVAPAGTGTCGECRHWDPFEVSSRGTCFNRTAIAFGHSTRPHDGCRLGFSPRTEGPR